LLQRLRNIYIFINMKFELKARFNGRIHLFAARQNTNKLCITAVQEREKFIVTNRPRHFRRKVANEGGPKKVLSINANPLMTPAREIFRFRHSICI